MSWASSTRRYDLPENWEELRSQVLREARYRCEIRTTGCILVATEVDHKNRGNDHSRSNLRAACTKCHGKKSSAEGNDRKRELRARRKRPPQRHPGRM
jgi:5-methylcytosine-specific restriction endonuclease McrA